MKEIDPAPSASRQHPALDIELVGLDGSPARLSDHLGDPLMVFVWASW